MLIRDIGAHIVGRAAGAGNATAGGTGDATEVDGPWIDVRNYRSAKLIVQTRAVLGAAATITLAANLQDATALAGTGAADFGPAVAATVVATGGGGGSTEFGQIEIDVDLTTCRGFLRAQFTPNLSAANTDTAITSATLILGGAQQI